MTDDPTRPIETGHEPGPAATAAEPTATTAEPTATTAEPTAIAAEPTSSAAEPGQAAAIDGAGTPAGTAPVLASGAPGSSRLRWAIGLGVAGLAIAVAVVAFIVLGSRPAPEALKYIPSDAALVAEVRMDLPGDQLQKLGNLLAHFPGFKDQATLSDKIDESLSRLVGQGSNGGVDYRADLKPWLSGPAFAGTWLPAGGAASSPTRGLVSATTTGTVSCATPFKGQAVTHETYRGLELFLGPNGTACVLDGRQALIGDVASVKAGLDAHASGAGMDHKSGYGAARAALQGDQLATFYVDGASYGSLLTDAGGMTPMMGDLSKLTGSLPAWAITGVRAEDDALVIDSVAGPALQPTAGATPEASLLPLPPAHASVIAPLAPANTLVYAEAQGAGVSLQNLISRLRTIPDLATAFQMLDGAGGADQLVGWVQDVGVIVIKDADKPTGGVALVAADDAAAAQRVATITGLVAPAGFGGNGIETHESTIAGITVTTITITDLAALVPPGQLPAGVQLPSDAHLEFSIAAKGRVILLGTGEGFITAVLNTQPGAGLADQASYKQATARALANSRLSVYVGFRDIVGFAEPLIPEADKAAWESDIKPYVAPFQALSLTSTTEASGSHTRLTITVSQP